MSQKHNSQVKEFSHFHHSIYFGKLCQRKLNQFTLSGKVRRGLTEGQLNWVWCLPSPWEQLVPGTCKDSQGMFWGLPPQGQNHTRLLTLPKSMAIPPQGASAALEILLLTLEHTLSQRRPGFTRHRRPSFSPRFSDRSALQLNDNSLSSVVRIYWQSSLEGLVQFRFFNFISTLTLQ